MYGYGYSSTQGEIYGFKYLYQERKKDKINDLNFHRKKLGKEEQTEV